MTVWIIVALFSYFLQASALFFDEFFFHMKRGLPRWERIGHPLDTLTVLAVNAVTLLAQFSSQSLLIFLSLAMFSCMFVTKDEWVHQRECEAAEHWLHAVLFVCHPMTFASSVFFWLLRDSPLLLGVDGEYFSLASNILRGQFTLLLIFLSYQIIYWNVFRSRAADSDARLSLQERQ